MEYWYKYRNDLWKKVTVFQPSPLDDFKRFDGEKNDCKTSDNIRRAQRQIEAYALCNRFQYFVTCTLDPLKYNRLDLNLFRKDLMQFVRDERKKYGDVQALFVPELHKKKDGWHMHGLLDGIPVESFRQFTLKEKLPKYLRDKIKSGQAVFDYPAYRKKFGFVDVELVKNRDAVARYITKYITKSQVSTTAKELALHKHLYYATRGLCLPECVEIENAPGSVPEAFPPYLVCGNTYEYDYGIVQWYGLSNCK